ncbi:hypothetical protein QYF61_016160 [Mycteria americana]|uniref:Uncharacterized protein n=1 Tax=Mycteria americana TaxID=33587 RepID=A0AAN7PK32_MYCAM|nr:hypothetical protein QYF61_016160 [Mycteria americana]
MQGEAERAGVAQSGEEKAQGELINMHKYLMEAGGEDYLQELKPYLFVRPNGLYPRAVRELDSVPTRLLSITFENFWRLGEIPENCRKMGVAPVLKKGQIWGIAASLHCLGK